MIRKTSLRFLLAGLLAVAAGGFLHAQQSKWAPDPKQPIDEEYTKKIKEYTTAPYFLSPLVDYLPASKTVPTPKAVIGDIAGAPGKLPYTAQVHEYMRALEKASPRVKVISIGKSEEGREMIAVAIADAPLIAKLDENRARLAKLADPRSIKLDDAEADRLVAASTPIYYITGTIHSPETGSPTALMELAYRLVVDDAPYIKAIRANVITLITPVVEADGRDRQADIYNWHLAHPERERPAARLLGPLPRARQQPRRHGRHAGADQERHQRVRRPEGAAAARPARVGAVPLRQHRRRRALQRLGRSDPDRRVAAHRLEQHVGDDQVRDARRVHARAVRHLVARLPDVHRGDAQRHEPAVRDVRQRRRGHRRARAPPERVRADLVPPEPAAAQGDVVAAQQQQLHRDRPADLALLLLGQQQAVPEELLPEGEAVGAQGEDRGAGGLRVPRRRSAPRACRPSCCACCRRSAARSPARPRRSPSRCRRRRSAAAAATGEAPRRRRPRTQPKPAGTPAEKLTETKQFPAGSYIVRMDQPYSRIADALLDYQVPGARAIRRRTRTTTPAGRSASCSTSRSSA